MKKALLLIILFYVPAIYGQELVVSFKYGSEKLFVGPLPEVYCANCLDSTVTVERLDFQRTLLKYSSSPTSNAIFIFKGVDYLRAVKSERSLKSDSIVVLRFCDLERGQRENFNSAIRDILNDSISLYTIYDPVRVPESLHLKILKYGNAAFRTVFTGRISHLKMYMEYNRTVCEFYEIPESIVDECGILIEDGLY